MTNQRQITFFQCLLGTHGMAVLLGLLMLLVGGCGTLGIGADPLVVRAEQTETAAFAAFDGLLRMDDSNRPFWRTNLPAFHEFAEKLRAPTATSHNTNLVLPRGAALIWDLNWEKNVYKTNKAAVPSFANSIQVLIGYTAEAVGWTAMARTNLALTKELEAK